MWVSIQFEYVWLVNFRFLWWFLLQNWLLLDSRFLLRWLSVFCSIVFGIVKFVFLVFSRNLVMYGVSYGLMYLLLFYIEKLLLVICIEVSWLNVFFMCLWWVLVFRLLVLSMVEVVLFSISVVQFLLVVCLVQLQGQLSVLLSVLVNGIGGKVLISMCVVIELFIRLLVRLVFMFIVVSGLSVWVCVCSICGYVVCIGRLQ